MTTVEIERLLNCDRPLDEEEWGEMSVARQRGALESTSLLKKAPIKAAWGGEIHNGSKDKSKADAETADDVCVVPKKSESFRRKRPHRERLQSRFQVEGFHRKG